MMINNSFIHQYVSLYNKELIVICIQFLYVFALVYTIVLRVDMKLYIMHGIKIIQLY